MIPYSDKIGFESLWVGQAWSTCYEMYFYFLFCLILLFRFEKKWLLYLIFSIFAISYVLKILFPNVKIGFIQYLYSLTGALHIIMFCIGIVIAQNLTYIKSKIRIVKKRYFIFLVGLYLLLLLTQYSYIKSLIISTSTFIIFLVSDLSFKKSSHKTINKILVNLGDISFSVYLVHSLVIRIQLLFGITNFWMVFLLTLFITTVISEITYKYIEHPFIQWSKRKK